MYDQNPYYPSKGPQDNHWLRSYRGIGLRTDNWRGYQMSSEHCQCPDCGYYWPTETGADFAGNTERRGGRCWQCWMAYARPDELGLIKQQAASLGKPTPNAAKAPESGMRKV